MLECNNPTILVWLDQAKSTIGKNVVIGEPRNDEQKIVGSKVTLEKDEARKNKLKITAGSTQFLRR